MKGWNLALSLSRGDDCFSRSTTIPRRSCCCGTAGELRQQVEAVHAKWENALNIGDQFFSSLYTSNTVQIDVFGRTNGVATEFVERLHRKGGKIQMPIEGVEFFAYGKNAMVCGSYSSQYADAAMSPGHASWMQIMERTGPDWRIIVFGPDSFLQVTYHRLFTG